MLSLAIIVKNEEKNLPRLLDSVKGLWDELVIVDTGSTDATVEIAKRYTDNVHHFKWVDDFAKARAFSFSKCSNPWVMWLDADDALTPEDVKSIREGFLANKDNPNINYFLINYYYWVEPPQLGGEVKASQVRERIIRKTHAHWKGRCHEHILVDWNHTYEIKNAGVWHLRDEEDRAADTNRNIRIMKLCIKDDPSPRNYFYLGDEYTGQGDTKKAISSYKKAFETSKNHALTFQAAYKIGKSYKALGKKDAIYWFKKSLDFEVAYREPLLELADIYLEKKDYSKAAFWAESALSIPEPTHPVMIILKDNYTWRPYDKLAKAYFKLRKYKEAINASEQVYEATRQPHILQDIALSQGALRETYKRPTGTVRLNLGSGGKTIPGFINCDLFPQEGVDEIFSMEEIPYADNTVDEISSEHALEHLPRPQAEKALREWARVLKKGGKLNLKVPDLEECCRKFVENPHLQERWYMHTLYGVQDFRDVPAAPFKDKVNYGQIHYTGFTESRLQRLLTENGFVVDRMYKYDGWDTPSLAVEAHIPDIPSDQKKRIGFINNSLVPKYLSYGDFWEDAFIASGHDVQKISYENVANMPTDLDLYFFVEAGSRYSPEKMPETKGPKILYSLEDTSLYQLSHFDIIATADLHKAQRWITAGNEVLILPNENHAAQVTKLLSIDDQTLERKKTGSTDIIIPSYKSLAYLQLTIESVRRNTEDYNLVVVNSGDDESVRDWLKGQEDLTFIDSEERLSFSQAVNKGLQNTCNDVVILNNDTLVGKEWLEALRASPFDITNPFSNCDAGWIHSEYPAINGVKLQPNMAHTDVDAYAIMDMDNPASQQRLFERPWVAFYATYIKREVITKTGVLDPTFVNGGEDYDYCRRAGKFGFRCGHSFASWVFHFGGKTRKVSEDENYNQHHEEDRFNNDHMKHKDRETVAIYTGPAWEPWTVENINTTGIGGSETCAALLAKAFVDKGYRCVIFGHCQGVEGVYDGVEYVHYTRFNEVKTYNYFDYFISSRTMAPMANTAANGKSYVWAHDIFIPECRGSHPPHSDAVNKFICLSPWHVDFFSDHHSVKKDLIYQQGNGIDLQRYHDYGKVEKNPNKLIYSSSPDRGLLQLLQMFPGWKQEFPDLELHVYYGFYNWKEAVKQRGNPNEIKHMESIETLLKQPGVHYHGRVSQKELAQAQMESALWVYPTWFTETYCITAIECMLAGAVPVCTSLAALETTVPDGCGVKVKEAWDCSEATLDLLRNPEKQEAYRKRGREYVLNNCGWDQIAENWIEMFAKT